MIWNGRAVPPERALRFTGFCSERYFQKNSQYAEALDELVKVGDELTATLNEKEKELFEDFMDAQREVTVLTDCETFCFAFKLGAKIMMDVLTDGPMKEI